MPKLKIKDNRKIEMIRYINMARGEMFLYNGDLFMKLSPTDAVDLTAGYLFSMMDSKTFVQPVEATVVIEK